jgi:hypothetical protein
MLLNNRYLIGLAVIAVLILANIVSWLFSGWGLITIHAHEMPLGQILKSIERQGWVTIYTDIPLTTPVSMTVDKVPIAEAMETLTANAGGQWKLGFFAAPTSAQVKQEIRSFQSASPDDDAKIYSYPTPLQILASDSDMPAADPRLQAWPGLKSPPPAPAPTNGTDGQGGDAPTAPPPAPSTIQDYLQALAQQTDIWIMAPGSWQAHVASAPSPSSSIASAVASLVGSAHGSVEQAIILRGRPQGGGRREGRGGGGMFGDTGWSYMEDRLRNAIGGLPAAARPAALAQLQDEVQFQREARAAPPDQRRSMMINHFSKHLGENFWRQSPEKRAQRYQQAVANRQAARGSG